VGIAKAERAPMMACPRPQIRSPLAEPVTDTRNGMAISNTTLVIYPTLDARPEAHVRTPGVAVNC
jgi:hypothetical protein